MRINVSGIGDGYDFASNRVQCPQHIESLPPGGRLHQDLHETPEVAEIGAKNEVSRIHEEEVAAARFRFRHAGVELFVDKGFLRLRVGFGGNRRDFTAFHPHLPHKDADLARTAADPRQGLNALRALVGGRCRNSSSRLVVCAAKALTRPST